MATKLDASSKQQQMNKCLGFGKLYSMNLTDSHFAHPVWYDILQLAPVQH